MSEAPSIEELSTRLEAFSAGLEAFSARIRALEDKARLYDSVVDPIFRSHLVRGASRTLFWGQKRLFGCRLSTAHIAWLDRLLSVLQVEKVENADKEAVRIFRAAFVNGEEAVLSGKDEQMVARSKIMHGVVPWISRNTFNLTMSDTAHIHDSFVLQDILSRLANDLDVSLISKFGTQFTDHAHQNRMCTRGR